MVTIKEIAERAGVSRRTVDRVINNRGVVKPETAERIRQIIKELDYQPNPTGQTLAARRRNIKIAFCSVKGSKSVIHEEIRKGAIKKTKELEQLGISVQFYIIDRDNPMTDEEIEQMINEFNCDGLAVVPGEEKVLRLLISRAEAMKIPIVFYNKDNKDFERSCYVGCDYYKSGQLAAGLMGLCANREMKVAIMTIGIADSSPEDASYKHRVEGFKSEIKANYPQIQVVDHAYLGLDVFDYYDAVRKLMNEHTDINGIYLVNPGDYSVCDAIKKVINDKEIRLITNDVTKEIMKYLEEGVVSATISQDPESQGGLPLQLLFDQLVLGKEPEKDIYYTDLNIYIPQSF